MNPGVYYNSRLAKSKLIEKKLIHLLNHTSFLRLLSMILFIYLLVRGIQLNNVYVLILSGLVLILFFTLVSFHKKKSDERKKVKALIGINEKELQALEGNFNLFNDGKEFLNPEHEFTYDLDIFGPDSLYQSINRCCTIEGGKTLASRFLNSPLKEEQILLFQKIHEELSKNPDFMQDYLATGLIIEEKEDEGKQIQSWLINENTGIPAFAYILAFTLAGLNLGILLFSTFIPGIINYLIFSVIISWFFYGIYFISINRYHGEVGRKQEIIRKFNKLSEILGKTNFTQELLKENAHTASKSIKSVKKLEKTLDIFDSRLNLLVGVVLNTLFMSDFYLILKLERWKKENRGLLNEIFSVHAETDAFISGAIYWFNHPEFVPAVPVPKGFSAVSMGHPLIHSRKCVVNDFKSEKDENIFIITGANMAGKSTFLRTIGVNLILAGAGFPVLAKKFEFETNPIITGMRTTDSLAESESYFFAELKRLKRIMDKLRKNEKLYVLLDEILKGTNSTDKHNGSEELIKQIVDYECHVFIATHDLQLGKLGEIYPQKIKNYHFESYIKDGELSFDYKIAKGIAMNMNASFLLKKMGILRK